MKKKISKSNLKNEKTMNARINFKKSKLNWNGNNINIRKKIKGRIK